MRVKIHEDEVSFHVFLLQWKELQVVFWLRLQLSVQKEYLIK